MRTQTAREKAEALVALIRQEFPNPRRMDDDSTLQGEWYCVGAAAARYLREYKIHRGWYIDYSVASITEPNDQGRFEEAWLALTDCYEDKFIDEMIVAEK